jgi:hypothetical protein
MVFDVVDECFMAMMLNEKNNDAADKLIDEAADFQDEMLGKINASKSKADFKEVRTKMEAAAIDFVKKLNKMA